MRLGVRDAAAMLHVSETQVYRWVDDGDIPHTMIHHRPLFHRIELLEWAMEHGIAISADLYEDRRGTPLTAALERGGGPTIDELDQIADQLPLDDPADRELARAILRARSSEMFVSRAADRIAVPQARSSLIVPGVPAAAMLAWCGRRALVLHGNPVNAVFVIVAPTLREHLQLLARLALVLRDDGFRIALQRPGSMPAVIAACRRIELELAREDSR